MRDFDPTASEYISSGYLEHSRPGGRLYDPMTIMAGATVLGGVMGANAAGDAADAQAGAAAASDATQRYQYDTTRADNAPFRDTGVQANNRLAYLMGLGGASSGTSGATGASGAGGMTAEQLRAELLGKYTTTAAPDPSLGMNWTRDGDNQIYTPQPGAQTIDENGLQAAIQARMGQQSQQTQAAQGNDPAFGSLTRNFGAADLAGDAVYQSGLQFGLNEGGKGINRQAAAGGSMLSGATLKALTRFGNDYGSTKANESYNRFNTNNNQQYNRLAGLSGAGQQATNAVSAAGTNMANNISASQQGMGNARGSAYLAQGNAWQNAINGGVSAFNSSNNANSPSPMTFDGTGAWRAN